MARFEEKLFIKAPSAKVWAFVSDPANLMHFIPSEFRKAIRLRLPEGKMKRGTKFAWVASLGGSEFEIDGEVTAWLDGKGVTYQSTTIPKIEVSFVISPEKGGSKLWAIIDYDLPLSTLGAFLGKPELEKNLSKDMAKAFDDLKRRLEAR